MPAPVIELKPPSEIAILDQTLLPGEERVVRLCDVTAICEAIASLRVRGAPLLGLAGAAGVAVAARNARDAEDLRDQAERIATTRPTAVDLRLRVNEALERALRASQHERVDVAWRFATLLMNEQKRTDTSLSAVGAQLVPPGGAVLTHCNTGELATGGIGTALGVIRRAWELGRLVRCYATETRPLLQGARLTTWELARAGIPATLLPDTAAGLLLASGAVAAVITGADRVAANGDTANKIGTHQLAVLAERHGVPFYVAAPLSTFDPACPDGAAIPIEMRDEREVGGFAGLRWSPDGVRAYNPAFDVTPAELIAAFITERGVARPPYAAALTALHAARLKA